MDIRKIIETTVNQYIKENIQLADKVYFNTGKLSEEDKEFIIDMTKGNNYTKIVSDFYFYLKDISFYPGDGTLENKLYLLYKDVLDYNKNVYPIKGYDVYNLIDIQDTIYALEKRRKILVHIKQLPSFAIRNLKGDIRTERTGSEMNRYVEDLDYFMTHYSLLSNRDEETQNKISKKMFKANTTLKDLMRFVDEKANFIGGVEFTKEDVIELSMTEDFDIIYQQGEVAIARVDSVDGIKAIGCNSLWCFTYGSAMDAASRQWGQYSYNGIVYVLIDFKESSDSENFMHVLIKPLLDGDDELIEFDEDGDEETAFPIFNMSNENYSDPYEILNFLFGSGYEKIIKEYLDFGY